MALTENKRIAERQNSWHWFLQYLGKYAVAEQYQRNAFTRHL